ncbi:MAG: lysophospholipid acyltransferase family protein [Myxococcales bacterium]
MKRPAAVPSDKSPVERLIGLCMWAPGVTWLSSMMSTMMLVQRFVPSDRIEWLTRTYTRGQVLLTGSRLHYHVHPAVDPKQVYMFAQNHVNMLDHCTCYNGTPHFKQGIELAAHFDVPFYGWFMRQRGTIPVYRDAKDGVRKLIEGVKAETERGHSILVFPEGTRTRSGRVGKFNSGVFRVAHSLGLPIVPTAVTGMFEVMRTGEPFINPGLDVNVYFDEPIPTRGVPESELPSIIERTQAAVTKRVDAYYAARGGYPELIPTEDAPEPEKPQTSRAS